MQPTQLLVYIGGHLAYQFLEEVKIVHLIQHQHIVVRRKFFFLDVLEALFLKSFCKGGRPSTRF